MAYSASIYFETNKTDEIAFLGELSLNRRIKGTKGVLPMCIKVILSKENADEAALIKSFSVICVDIIKDIIEYLS